MRVLFRVAAALLIAIPLFLVLATVFALAGRRRASLPLEGGTSRSFERGATVGSFSARERGGHAATPLVMRNATPGDH
jgi:hypothetical protein